MTAPLSSSSTTYTLPAVGGISGTVTTSAATAPVTGTMAIATASGPCSTVSPFAAGRTVKSQTISVFFCATFTPSVDITFTNVPSISLAIPIDPTGKQFFFAISQPPASPAIAQFRQEGPAHVTTTTANGCVLAFEATFDNDNAPLSLKAGVPVVFAFYSTEAVVAPTPSPAPSVKPTAAPTATPTPTGTVSEFRSGFSAAPGKLALGSDGNIYFTESTDTSASIALGPNFVNEIGRITPTGAVTEFSPIAGFNRFDTFGGITAGHGGTIFYSGVPPCFGCPFAAANVIGTLSGGSTSVFANPHQFFAGDLTIGPDGNVWYGGLSQGAGPRGGIGHTSSAGAVEFVFPAQDGAPTSITSGPDGNIWFTGFGPSGNGTTDVGNITTGGTITIVIQPGTIDAHQIVAGPDGNLWTIGTTGISRITPGGKLTTFTDPNQQPATITYLGIAAGPDGNLWFTAASPSRVGRITPQGTITDFTSGITGQPGSIVAGTDGFMYFADGGGIDKIKT